GKRIRRAGLCVLLSFLALTACSPRKKSEERGKEKESTEKSTEKSKEAASGTAAEEKKEEGAKKGEESKKEELPAEFLSALEEISKVNYEKKENSSSLNDENAVLKSAGPIAVYIPKEGYYIYDDPEKIQACVTVSGERRYANVTLKTKEGSSPFVRNYKNRFHSLEDTFFSPEDAEDLQAKPIDLDGTKWLRVSYKRISRSKDGDSSKNVESDFVIFQSFLQNREVELCFEHEPIADQYKGFTGEPFTEEGMEEIVKSVHTVPVKVPDAVHLDSLSIVDKKAVKADKNPGYTERMEKIKLDPDADQKKWKLKDHPDIVSLLDGYLSDLKKVDPKSLEDVSSFSGGVITLSHKEKDKEVSMKIPEIYNSGPLYHFHRNTIDYNPEYGIGVSVSAGREPERKNFASNFVEGHFIREEEAGVQVVGDRGFLVLLQLDESTLPAYTMLRKKAITYADGVIVEVDFSIPETELSPLNETELEILKSISIQEKSDIKKN
ncbi:MAG: hypothetical protein ACFN2Z_00460, partial [Oribacterium sp.]